MRILYIHGFNSGQNGKNINKIRSFFPDAEIIAPKHYSTVQSVINTIEPIAKTMELTDIIAGTSLGAFWARYFARKYNTIGIFINPIKNPAKTTMAYIDGLEWVELDSLAYKDFECFEDGGLVFDTKK